MVEVDPAHRLLYAIRLCRNNFADCYSQGVSFVLCQVFLTSIITNKNIQPKKFAWFLYHLHLLITLRPKTSKTQLMFLCFTSSLLIKLTPELELISLNMAKHKII